MKNVIALVFCVAACGGAIWTAGTPRWFDQCDYGKQSLAKRAAFDLSCPEASLQFQQLGADWQTVGVVGCEKRSTYVYDGNRLLWVMNTDTRAAAN